MGKTDKGLKKTERADSLYIVKRNACEILHPETGINEL